MPISVETALDDISPCQSSLFVSEDNAALRDCLLARLRADGFDVPEASTVDELLDTLAASLHADLRSDHVGPVRRPVTDLLDLRPTPDTMTKN